MIDVDARTAALVLIDLQKGIVGPMDGGPRAATAARGAALAKRFRAVGSPVVLVNIDVAPDFADALRQPVDSPLTPPGAPRPADWATLIDGLAEPGDLRVTKRQWGAFTGTELDLQLRRRGIGTIVLAGLATNFGVESTARHAWELNYEVVVVEDACASISPELHEFSIRRILPRIARITTSDGLRLSGERS